MLRSIYAACFAIAVTVLWLTRHRKRLPLPPGPRAEPIIGHARILPSENQEIVFFEWSKIYGEIMHFRIPGRNYIVLNSLKAANELLEKRSGIYSSRPRFIIFELMGWFPMISLLPYGKRFQKHRRLMNEYLHQNKCEEYKPLQTSYTRKLVVDLMDNPHGWFDHLERFATSMIVRITYGHDVLPKEDPYLNLIHKATESLTACGSPGGTPVDFLPFLRYLPRWFPGSYYAYKAKTFEPLLQQMFTFPYFEVKKQLENGTAKPSYMSHHLNQFRQEDFQDHDHVKDIQVSAAAMYGAATDTTHGSLAFFVYSMVLFPECQRKAQEEIDRVIGRERLPELDDRESLPYVNAILQETYRWNAVAPLGIPHLLMEDDVYNGMFIPKGSTVIANARAILRDEAIYSNPDHFNPDRYLPRPSGNSEPHPIGQFGFGRRICPGRHFADGSLWIAISTILATLTIEKAVDESGSEIVPKLELVTGITSHPKPFPCSIKPRDKITETLARQAQLWQH